MADKKEKPVGGSKEGEDSPPPRNSHYEKPLKPKKIEDKTGWKVLPENDMILKGKSSTNKADGIYPEGFVGED